MTLLAFTSANAVVIAFAIVFGMVLLVPWTIDLIFAELNNRKTDHEPRGTPGLSRATMSLGVLTVIGFALMYLIVAPPVIAGAGTLIRDIVIALTTTLAAITAFYFGTKAAERSSKDQPVAISQNPEKLPGPEVILEVGRHHWSDEQRAALIQAANRN